MSKKPDDELAGIIIKKLNESKTIDSRFLEKLKKGYETGNLTSEDWTLFVEEKPKQGGKNEKKN